MAIYIRMRLADGQLRHLDTYTHDAGSVLDKVLRSEDPWGEPYLATLEQTDVARAHVVEIYEVELETSPVKKIDPDHLGGPDADGPRFRAVGFH